MAFRMALLSFTFVLLWTFEHATAFVADVAHADVTHLARRQLTEYLSCTDEQTAFVEKSHQDAITLARYAVIDNPFQSHTDSSAYTHYFRPEDVEQASNILKVIGDDLNTETPAFQYKVNCSGTFAHCDDSTLAITDSQSKPNEIPIMHLCRPFFTNSQTRNGLESKRISKKPRKSSRTWCNPDRDFSYFETAGLTWLHEMTHLNAVGILSGLPKFKGWFGTVDYISSDETHSATDARKLKDAWVAGTVGKGDPPPFQNAESIAAFATEWYFTQKCGLDDIGEH